MMTKKISDGALALIFVSISSLLFAGFESQISPLTKTFAVDLYIGVRLVGTTALIGLIYLLISRSGLKALILNPIRLNRFI